MNNYEEVAALREGVVFQFEKGSPWLRTEKGVVDLMPGIVELGARPIPEIWRSYHYKVTILYVEGV